MEELRDSFILGRDAGKSFRSLVNNAVDKLLCECGSDPNHVVKVTRAKVKRADEIERENELVQAAEQVAPVSPDSIVRV